MNRQDVTSAFYDTMKTCDIEEAIKGIEGCLGFLTIRDLANLSSRVAVEMHKRAVQIDVFKEAAKNVVGIERDQ